MRAGDDHLHIRLDLKILQVELVEVLARIVQKQLVVEQTIIVGQRVRTGIELPRIPLNSSLRWPAA